MLDFQRRAANGCSVNHLCRQTDPIMSANPGNTGGKFKSSSMKHLINILNVFLAIYAYRAMGCFGVPLIFHWRRSICEGGWCGGLCTGQLAEEQPWGWEERRFLHPRPRAGGGSSYLEYLLSPFQEGTASPRALSQILTLACCRLHRSSFAEKSWDFGVNWSKNSGFAYIILCDFEHVSYPLWVSAIKQYPCFDFVMKIKEQH